MPKRTKRAARQGRPVGSDRLLARIKKLGVFRFLEVEQLGISRAMLSRWQANGKVLRLGQGLYVHPEAKVEPEIRDYAAACLKFGPRSVIGGLTALFHYGLIDQVPQRIWIVVPYRVQTRDRMYRCIRTQTDPTVGIEVHSQYRITNLERTLVEALRYASKLGLRTALHATRTALANKQTTLPKIHAQAKALRLERFVEKYWESIVPEAEAS